MDDREEDIVEEEVEFEDKELRCVDCKQSFTFTKGEQEFFYDKGLTPPKRCVPCREKKKAARAGQ